MTTHTYFDVSSVANYYVDVVTGCILELTNGSRTAVVKYRNFGAGTWYAALETNITLKVPFTGSTTKIAIISDTHIGVGEGNPGASFTTAINDIDDNITGVSHVFVCGDIVHDDAGYYGTDAGDYKTIRATSDIASANWHELAGNHDVLAGANGFKAELLGSEGANAYYTVTIGNCVFILLSDETQTEPYEISNAANTWLATTLFDNASNNCIILTHQGQLWTTKETDRTAGYIGNIDDAIGLNDYAIWFQGHTHGFGAGHGTPTSANIFTETSQDLNANLKEFYPMNEAAGSIVHSNQSLNTGSLGGNCAWGVDGSEDFVDILGGAADSIDIAHNSNLLFGANDFSLGIRLYVSNSEFEIIEKQGATGYFQFISDNSPTGELFFHGGKIALPKFGRTHKDVLAATTVLDVLLVRDATLGSRIYVDGVGRVVTIEDYANHNADPDDAGATLRIGRGTGGQTIMRAYYFGVWDSALNRIDAKNIMANPYRIGRRCRIVPHCR